MYKARFGRDPIVEYHNYRGLDRDVRQFSTLPLDEVEKSGLNNTYALNLHSEVRPTIPYPLVRMFPSEPGTKYEALRRSGLTPPIVPRRTEPRMRIDQRRTAREDERYQRRKLKHWTTRTLLDLGMVEEPTARPSDLDDTIAPLHPIFKRENWDLKLDLGLKFFGHQGSTIWKAILPSLRLASLLLSNSKLWPWWDALIFNNHHRLDPSDHVTPKEYELRRFWRRAPDRRKGPIRQEDWWHSIQNRLRFEFAERPLKKIFAYAAHTGIKRPFRGGMIRISDQFPRLLLRKDLTVSQRLIYQYFWAISICHEVAHGVSYLAKDLDWHGEPFFENDMIAEVGLSWESSIMGGVLGAVNHHEIDSMPILTLLLNSWPAYDDLLEYMLDPDDFLQAVDPTFKLQKGGPFSVSEAWPVPIAHVSDLQQKAFWKFQVPRYGAMVIQDFPKLWGTSETYDGLGERVVGKGPFDFLVYKGREVLEHEDWAKGPELLNRRRELLPFNPQVWGAEQAAAEKAQVAAGLYRRWRHAEDEEQTFSSDEDVDMMDVEGTQLDQRKAPETIPRNNDRVTSHHGQERRQDVRRSHNYTQNWIAARTQELELEMQREQEKASERIPSNNDWIVSNRGQELWLDVPSTHHTTNKEKGKAAENIRSSRDTARIVSHGQQPSREGPKVHFEKRDPRSEVDDKRGNSPERKPKDKGGRGSEESWDKDEVFLF